MSEYANQKTRGAFIAAVFAMQGVGIVAGATVSIIVASIFRRSFPSPPFNVNEVLSQPREADYVWRIIFMFGAVPALVTFYYRMQMPETARYTALVIKNNRRAAQDMGRVLQVSFPSFDDNPVEHTRGQLQSHFVA